MAFLVSTLSYVGENTINHSKYERGMCLEFEAPQGYVLIFHKDLLHTHTHPIFGKIHKVAQLSLCSLCILHLQNSRLDYTERILYDTYVHTVNYPKLFCKNNFEKKKKKKKKFQGIYSVKFQIFTIWVRIIRILSKVLTKFTNVVCQILYLLPVLFIMQHELFALQKDKTVHQSVVWVTGLSPVTSSECE